METTKKVSMKCGVCGNTNFEYDDALYKSIEDAEEVKCTVCNKVYTISELKEVNTTLINNAAKELGKEMLEKELKKSGFKFEVK